MSAQNTPIMRPLPLQVSVEVCYGLMAEMACRLAWARCFSTQPEFIVTLSWICSMPALPMMFPLPSVTFTAFATLLVADYRTSCACMTVLAGTSTPRFSHIQNLTGCKLQVVLRLERCTVRSTWAVV